MEEQAMLLSILVVKYKEALASYREAQAYLDAHERDSWQAKETQAIQLMKAKTNIRRYGRLIRHESVILESEL